jgi:transcriptional regulator with XRE-family HTH domain
MTISPEPVDARPERSPGENPERLWRDVVGEQLRGIRRSRGETLQSVAERARVSPQYLSEIERGSKEASSEILAAIGASLDISMVDLTRGAASRLSQPAPASLSIAPRVFALAA